MSVMVLALEDAVPPHFPVSASYGRLRAVATHSPSKSGGRKDGAIGHAYKNNLLKEQRTSSFRTLMFIAYKNPKRLPATSLLVQW